MAVTYATSVADVNAKIATGAPVVAYFSATWCGPCKMIAPKVDEFAKQYPGTTFIKIDVDELEELAQQAGVSAMPTFQLYKDGSKVGEVIGANPAKLGTLLETNQ
ncbi:thioredoxin [Blastocladiella britannica]|nr:thioredoxin [Blastocladiella britannica]